jgi:hypothetical protein
VSTLHVTNGSHVGDKLRRFVDGPVTLACDVLHEGPCPSVDGNAWHQVRARFLAGFGRPADELEASLAADDRAVVDARERGDKIVLWFEHDLFDQLALIRTLDLIVRPRPDTTETRGRTSPRVSLICIDRFPGVDRFIGLGQLTSEQLATLAGTGVPLTAGHYALAIDAWHAFRSPDPTALLAIAHQLNAARTAMSEGGPALAFLGDALLRFFAEFPSATTGLSRTEELALEALLAGPMTAGALFGVTQANEARPFMGDSTFFAILRGLAAARVPLVTVDGGREEIDPGLRRVAIADAGRDVLARRADHVRLNGIDLWRGGVHLAGSNRSPWRWDGGAETLVS